MNRDRYVDLKYGEVLTIEGGRGYKIKNPKKGFSNISGLVSIFNFGNRHLGRRNHLRITMPIEYSYEIDDRVPTGGERWK